MRPWTGITCTLLSHTLVLFSKMSIPLRDRKRWTLLFLAAFSGEYLSAVYGWEGMVYMSCLSLHLCQQHVEFIKIISLKIKYHGASIVATERSPQNHKYEPHGATEKKKQGIMRFIRIHLLGTMAVSSKHHRNPSNNSWDGSKKPKYVNFIVVQGEKSGDHQNHYSSSIGTMDACTTFFANPSSK